MGIDITSWEGYNFIEPVAGQKLSIQEADYWIDQFVKNLKIAYEIEAEMPTHRDEVVWRDLLRSKLDCTDQNAGISKYAVKTVSTDGSLDNGIEVNTQGLRIHYWNLVEKLTNIMDCVQANGGHITPKCGQHIHLLFSYESGKTELEQPIPGIIFKNFYNLIKRHLPELVYLSAALDENKWNAITRYEAFCNATQLIGKAANKPLSQVVDGINYKTGTTNKHKYAFLNTYSIQAVNEELRRFHVEMRYLDGTLSVQQSVANGILLAALMVRAVEFSKYGIVECGTAPYWAATKMYYKMIRNNADCGYCSVERRVSEKPDQAILDEIQLRAKHFVLSMRQSIRFFDRNASAVLEKMAGYPVFAQLKNRNNYKQIDKFLQVKDERDKARYVDITKIIDTYQVINCKDKREWEEKAAVLCNMTYKTMNNVLWKLSKVRNLTFDRELGAVIFIE